jgi:hypothetical protein
MKTNRMNSYALLVSVAAILLLSTLVGSAQFPDFPPDKVTSLQDRNQMLWQLGISLPVIPPRAADPNRPAGLKPTNPSNPEGANWTDGNSGHTITRSTFGLWNNYDDDKVGVYTPLDLLKMKNGEAIKTPVEWWTRRRPEIVKDVQEQVWGVIPPVEILPAVAWSVTASTGTSGGIPYKEKTITGTIDISRYPQVRNAPKISATLRTPADAKGRVPVIVSFGGTSGASQLLQHGWGICNFNPNPLQPDSGAGLTSYLIGLVNKGNWRKPTDWGSLAAWSWGVSRLMDYFETDPDVDATKIGVTGHSRYGKASIVAMAYEPRLAIAFPSCAGSLGTKMNRRHWGQDLENSGWDQEYHWMAGNFFKWMGPLKEGSFMPRKVELLLVDAHSLVSLCAPRPVFINGGTTDNWTDGYGMYLSAAGATPVYRLLGKKGVLMPDDKPKIDVAYISGDLGYRYHAGGHTDAPDWPTFIEFASRYFDRKAPVDESGGIEISQTVKKSGRTSATTVKITNHSVYRMRAPLWFVAKNLKTGAVLANAAGKTPDGDSYIAVPGSINPGESVTMKVSFSLSTKSAAAEYTPALYSGNWLGPVNE